MEGEAVKKREPVSPHTTNDRFLSDSTHFPIDTLFEYEQNISYFRCRPAMNPQKLIDILKDVVHVMGTCNRVNPELLLF